MTRKFLFIVLSLLIFMAGATANAQWDFLIPSDTAVAACKPYAVMSFGDESSCIREGRFLHVTWGGGWTSTLVFLNPSDVMMNMNLIFYDQKGQYTAMPLILANNDPNGDGKVGFVQFRHSPQANEWPAIHIRAKQSITLVFPDDGSVTAQAVQIVVAIQGNSAATIASFVAQEVFSNPAYAQVSPKIIWPDQAANGTAGLTQQTSTNSLFGAFVQGNLSWTASANLVITVRSCDGSVVGTKSLVLGPGEVLVNLLANQIPAEMFGDSADYYTLEFSADQPVGGFLLNGVKPIGGRSGMLTSAEVASVATKQ